MSSTAAPTNPVASVPMPTAALTNPPTTQSTTQTSTTSMAVTAGAHSMTGPGNEVITECHITNHSWLFPLVLNLSDSNWHEWSWHLVLLANRAYISDYLDGSLTCPNLTTHNLLAKYGGGQTSLYVLLSWSVSLQTSTMLWMGMIPHLKSSKPCEHAMRNWDFMCRSTFLERPLIFPTSRTHRWIQPLGRSNPSMTELSKWGPLIMTSFWQYCLWTLWQSTIPSSNWRYMEWWMILGTHQQMGSSKWTLKHPSGKPFMVKFA